MRLVLVVIVFVGLAILAIKIDEALGIKPRKGSLKGWNTHNKRRRNKNGTRNQI